MTPEASKRGHDRGSGDGECVAEGLDPREFLARVLVHIPEPRRHLVRYYGWYSNVSRGKRKRQGPADGPPRAAAGWARSNEDRSPDARALRRRWAEMIKRVYEVDPLVCPKCHGEMRIIAFIVDPAVVDKILRHLRAKDDHRERGPPGWAGLAAAL